MLRRAKRRIDTASVSRQSGPRSRFCARCATLAISSSPLCSPFMQWTGLRAQGFPLVPPALTLAVMQGSDVIILGGGLVGLALAAALDASGLRVTVVDPADPDTRLDAAFDGRTSA
ncbi:NAD-binding protein, partial [Sphingomonas sp.]|uniref:NAD-binding protein n=1 Tax=Sphingomonas sp. TaxID=28214 RepID=UPI0038665F5F